MWESWLWEIPFLNESIVAAGRISTACHPPRCIHLWSPPTTHPTPANNIVYSVLCVLCTSPSVTQDSTDDWSIPFTSQFLYKLDPYTCHIPAFKNVASISINYAVGESVPCFSHSVSIPVFAYVIYELICIKFELIIASFNLGVYCEHCLMVIPAVLSVKY